MMTGQISLFGNSPIIAKQEKARWSYSKREVLRQCPRKYYHQYYDKSDEVKFYKSLSNKYLVTGKIVHLLVSVYLKHTKTDRRTWTIKELTDWGIKQLNSAADVAMKLRDDPTLDIPQYVEPFLELVTEDLDSLVLLDECYEKIETSLANFLGSEKFTDLIEGSLDPESMVEINIPFKLTDDITVYGKLDAAYKKNDKLVIVDWKTGKRTIEDSSLQLSVYGLWASQKHGIAAEDIEIKKAYIYADVCTDLSFNGYELERAKARIMQDAMRIRELSEYGKNGIMEAFDTADSPGICNQCSFKKICYEKRN